MRQLNLFEIGSGINYNLSVERIRRNGARVALSEVIKKNGCTFANNHGVAARINKYTGKNTVEVRPLCESSRASEVVLTNKAVLVWQ